MTTSGSAKRYGHASAPLSPALEGRRTRCLFYREDRAGLNLAYVYFENEPGGRSASKLLTNQIKN
jgi:hypothetical protein